MYTHPNQPQRPSYAQPPQPPSQGQLPYAQPPQPLSYGQPPYAQSPQPAQQYRPPQSPPQYRRPPHAIQSYALPPQQQPSSSRQASRPILLTVFFVLLVLLAGGIIAAVVLIITPPTGTPTPTINRGATTLTATTPALAVTNYYAAIKNQDYATAFQYLDAKFVSDNAQPMTEAAYSKVAQGLDAQAGKVTSYSITSTVTDSNGIVIITVHAIRLLNGTSQPHDTHLQLKRESSGWKIIGLDNI